MMASSGGDPSIATAKQAVDKIVKHIETEFSGFNISEILKAGSLGDGTAVPGNYDIDLVVFSRDFTGMDVLQSPTLFKPWVSKLKEFIQHLSGVELIPRRGRAENFSVQFSYQVTRGISIDVDLLASPYWSSPHEFYDFLRTVPPTDRMNFSVCASKWQREFFKRQEDQVVKECIRRAKVWRNRTWGSSLEGKPKSYLLSLLVVAAYENARKSDPQRLLPKKAMLQRITSALKSLVEKERMDVYWADEPEDFYKRSDYPNLLPSRPRIIDPANPANNVWETGFTRGGPHVLISKIDSIDLSRPI